MDRTRHVIAAAFLTLAVQLCSAMPAAAAGAGCQFVLGFKTLHDLAPQDTGECAGNQTSTPNGDAQQQTTTGLMVWRKADNWTAFTNGYKTWLSGPDGLAVRLNTERFPWEADYGTTVLHGPGWSIQAPNTWKLTTTGPDSAFPGLTMAAGVLPRPSISVAVTFRASPLSGVTSQDLIEALVAKELSDGYRVLGLPAPVTVRGADGRELELLKEPNGYARLVTWLEGGQGWMGLIACKAASPEVETATGDYFVNTVLPTLTIP